MARQGKEARVADGATVMGGAEAVLLHVAGGLEGKGEGEEHDAGHVAAGAKGVLRVAADGRAVEHGDGQGDGPDPEHLEDPEAEEGEEAVALVVEAVVGAGAEDAEEEKGGEADGPGDEEERGDELAGIGAGVGARREAEGEEGDEDKVGAAGEVWTEGRQLSGPRGTGGGGGEGGGTDPSACQIGT